ncbi:Glycosyl transferase family 9 [Candidatus Desulfarcum epimagneticum]|uniref:Glycosyl transferase family 9 n=1 Tax=uncultured Desulfobacteraceae bacterium TaxID=218296 RepID=A0A484HI66_9BACT|nr:Glycosyl transferase family 9 [uncultured Desulfobacteraceae bacterium]
MKKILIIKFSAIGDVFMAMPHIDAILSAHKKDEVWLLTSRLFMDFFARHPRLKAVELDPGRRISKNSALGRTLWARRQKFDAVCDLQGNRVSRRIARHSGAPVRAGTQPSGAYNFHPERPYTNQSRTHVTGRLDETLESAGLPRSGKGFSAYPSPEDEKKVAEWKEKNGVADGGHAILHAGSSKGWESKRWPGSHYRDLALRLEAEGVRCVWVGGREDREINREMARWAGIDATGHFSLMGLYLMGKNAKLAVCNDSAPMHIMAAAGAPTYGFFGPTSWMKNHASGQRRRVIQNDSPCSPCFSGKCPPDRNHMCLDAISPGEVFDTIRRDLPLS